MRIKENMRWMASCWMVLAVMVFCIGCSDDNEKTAEQPVPPTEQPEDDEPEKTAAEVLSAIPGVTIIQNTQDAKKQDVTLFYFDQPIDHNDASAGTFRQYCALHYKGRNCVNALHTQGYSTNEPEQMSQPDLSTILDGNYIEIEHRYYKHSPINKDAENYDAEYWKYNTAAQSTADLHTIVTALKQSGYFNGKWVSTGVSKNGILTALYAYYYPNEMDVYVPFCAPFCTEAESPGIGKYITEQCGKGTEAQQRIWSALQRMLTDEQLRTELTALYKKDYPNNADIQKYSTSTAMCAMLLMFIRNLFSKFAYQPLDTWADVTPQYVYSAETYYRFIKLDNANFVNDIKALRNLLQLEDKELFIYDYEYDSYDDYETEYDDDWSDLDDDEQLASRRVPKMSFEQLLADIYKVHAAKELGSFCYDWSMLPADFPPNHLKWLNAQQSITFYNKKYGVEYDGGKLMNDFLAFVKNNRNNNKCKMLFVYGANDPWTGAAIPDPDADDPYVKKFVVPNGVHSGWLNFQYHYTTQDRDYIVNTVKQMLQQ